MNRKLLPLFAVCAGIGLTACASSGSHGKNASSTSAKSPKAIKAAAVAKRDAAASRQTAKNLTARPSNELVLDGFSEGSISQAAYRDYQVQGGGDVVSIENDPAQTAFTDFCTGSVDIVDSASSISKPELAKCENDGITPVQIQVGSDAVVLATENETDVGADCLTEPQVKEIFKAGSPIENWDQLGFDDVALKVAGPNPANQEFNFFGSALEGAGDPTLQDFRFDYHDYAGQDGVRQFVIGSQAAGAQALSHLPVAQNEISNLDAVIKGWDQAVVGAKAGIKASKQTNNTKQLAIAKRHLATAKANLKTLNGELTAEQKVISRYKGVERTAEEVLGRLGVFQYGYYTLYEQELRPLEITSASDPENCIFPSQDTITSGAYPLSRQLLLTFSLQALRSNPSLRAFLLSYLKNANTLTTNEILVPLPNNVLVQEEDALEGKKTPTAVTGATASSGGENSMSGVTGSGAVSNGTTTSTTSGSTGTTGSGAQSGVAPGVH
jgi:ABC-type phosphate transport system substrate-binding protein